MKAAILGTSGYTGLVLLRLLTNHPEVDDIIPVSSSKGGEMLSAIDPGAGMQTISKCVSTSGKVISIEEAFGLKPDVVFAGLPHLKSAELCAPFFGKCVVIDLSADFRIKDPAVFEAAYGAPQPVPHIVQQAVYGLSEWYREKIKTADIIANPGCYPTAALLPLLPLVKEGIVGGKCIISAISGISGAGKKTSEMYLYCERTENACAYAPGKIHRHRPEIQQEIDFAAKGIDVYFTPHLAPLKRGMVTTIAIPLLKSAVLSDIEKIYGTYYGESPFISIKKRVPETKDVWGSNRCDIYTQIQDDMLILISCIDNLIKGASGQALQNMNIRFGIPEEAGLTTQNEI
jgi:N-acetyl-gamma-glutamyl-phosphate reductase